MLYNMHKVRVMIKRWPSKVLVPTENINFKTVFNHSKGGIYVIKKRYLTIFTSIMVILLCILAGILFYRYLLKKPYLNGPNNIVRITITMLPSPPEVKTIQNKDDIKKFTDILDKYTYKPALPSTRKGWDIKIDIVGSPEYTIVFSGNYMECNGTRYSIDKALKEDIRQLFQTLKP
jgi:hypothetical protein